MNQKIEKKWAISPADLDQVINLTNQLNLSIPIGYLLLNRGITSKEEAQKFLYPQWEDLHDPFRFNDMEKAVKRIKKAIDRKEKICIYGDYDTDGTTATSLLIHAFKFLGVEVEFYIPSRFKDGYGVNKTAIRTIASQNVDLLITVDCGITSVEEIKLANKLEIDSIITDHHLPKKENLPPACALITPQLKENEYPYSELAGVGLAFKLACALIPDKDYLVSLLDLVTIGTVVDVAPLTGENRVLTKLGLDILNNPDKVRRTGIRALCSVAGYKENQDLKGYSLSFGLGPRINAAGRMGSANKIVKLLTTEDYEEALSIAMKLDEVNLARKELESKIKDQALEIIKKENLQNNSGIVIANEWGKNAKGVIGIVASRILEDFYKPVILLTIEGNEASGSGRCIEGLNLSDALTSCSKHLLKYGGHAVAAGLSLNKENVDEFRKDFCDYIDKNLTKDYLVPKLSVDHNLDLSLIDLDYLNELSLFEPFGNKNQSPKLMASNIKLKEMPVRIGKTKQHLSLKLKSDLSTHRSLYWRGAQFYKTFCNPSNVFDLVFSPEINEYQNRKTVQIIIEDWKSKSLSQLKSRKVYPENELPSPDFLLKIVDARGKNKLSYLKTILTRKEPALIYVRDEKSADFLIKTFRKEFPNILKSNNSNVTHKDLFNNLSNGKIQLLVTTDFFKETLEKYPFIKHHIFCHPQESWEEFYQKCLPAIFNDQVSGIHLLYNSLDRNHLEEIFQAEYSNSKFLTTNLKSFLDFQYQKDIKLIWEKIYEQYQSFGRRHL